jgi:hypothetical protein
MRPCHIAAAKCVDISTQLLTLLLGGLVAAKDRGKALIGPLQQGHPNDSDLAYAGLQQQMALIDLSAATGDTLQLERHVSRADEVLRGMQARGMLAGDHELEVMREQVDRQLIELERAPD